MSDIIEKLRASAIVLPREKCIPEAADEIQILRGQVEALNSERDRLWAEKLIMQGEITRLREENARLREKNSELVLRGFALLSLLPPDTTCGEVQKAKAALSAAAIMEGGKND